MKIILSPAKSIDESVSCENLDVTQPVFQEESARLQKKLAKLSVNQISKLMGISKELSELNHKRYQEWSLPFTKENSLPAGLAFSGAAYQGMDYASLSSEEMEEGQNRLRILSGLYGLLKPLDLIQPYRLEMGTRFAVTPKVKNLYLFWGDKIRKTLEDEMKEEGSSLLVNVASSEYFKAAQLGKMDVEVITPIFKDLNKKGEYKVNMQFAKLSRGRMSRFIIQNKIEKAEELKAFDVEGYYFVPAESSDTEYIFHRDSR
ncbi:MAG: peroxide stress protein YaaA [Flavobacteriales bacterium]|nr:peroxide stress protein YaaA [Flavobacteriales bacterium]